MKQFLHQVSPRRAVLDLWKILGSPSEFKWRGLLFATLITGSMLWVMVHQGGRALPLPPKVIYFNSWRADRSDAEIIAGNIAAARAAREEAAAAEARAEDMRQMYRAVGKASGLDADKTYEQGKIDRANAARARAAADKALLDRYLPKGAKLVDDPQAASSPGTP